MAKYAYVETEKDYDVVVPFVGFSLNDLKVEYKELEKKHKILIDINCNDDFFVRDGVIRHNISNKYFEGKYKDYSGLENFKMSCDFGLELSEKIDVENTKITMKHGLLRIQAPKLNQPKEFPNQENKD